MTEMLLKGRAKRCEACAKFAREPLKPHAGACMASYKVCNANGYLCVADSWPCELPEMYRPRIGDREQISQAEDDLHCQIGALEAKLHSAGERCQKLEDTLICMRSYVVSHNTPDWPGVDMSVFDERLEELGVRVDD